MKSSDYNIAILMATYNGEKYICEQIDSILAQTYKDWCLYIHDDGSKDGTKEILNQYAIKYPDHITVMEYSSQGSALQNFMSMLERVEANYYMFSDQDDVWLPNKVEESYKSMLAKEREMPDIPIIVNTDLKVVDQTLNVIDESFWHYEGIFPAFIKDYKDHAAENTVTGCTMLINAKAKNVIHKPYDNALMHDAWITLSVYASGGEIIYLHEPTMLYRQHSGNVLGAKDVKRNTIGFKLRHFCFVLMTNVRHYKQMRTIKPISIIEYIDAKIRYRKYLKNTDNILV